MPDSGVFALFLIGLLGGTHCIAMCGGIVSALTLQQSTTPAHPPWALQLSYNLGRIASYTLAGALMGAIGSLGLLLNHAFPVQLILYLLANLMLIALGVYLMGMTRSLAFIERTGQHLWKHIQPLTRHFSPARKITQTFPLGLLWGFLPCGMVYSALSTALLSGSATRGASLMLAFGLGTLPNLLLAGLLLHRLRKLTQNRTLRIVSGLLILGFGVHGLFNAATLENKLWNGILCLT